MISEKEYQARMAAAAGKPHMKVTPVPRLDEQQILRNRIMTLAVKVEELEFENACLLEELRELDASRGRVSFWNDEGDEEEWTMQ